MGDVISITDAQGIELVQYEYDAWGKCVSTVTAQDYENTQKNNLERQAAFLRSKIKVKHSNSYIGFLYSQSDYDF